MAESAPGGGFSLWVMPEGEIGRRLARWIETLALRFRTDPFPPHLTLLGGIAGEPADVAQRAARAAAELSPFPIHIDGVDGRDEHFRCLFVQALEAAPLVAAHATAARAFGREPDPAYLPHLSLLYGRLEPVHKLALRHEVGSEVDARFEARRLHVWQTEGPVTEWRELGAFDFARVPPTA